MPQRLGEAGQPGSAPTIYRTTLVLVPLGVVWSWCWGQGTASEHHHLRQLRRTLPRQALSVADACYRGYESFAAILQAQAAFWVRLSSRASLYTTAQVPLAAWTAGRGYYWPAAVQAQGRPPIPARLRRVKGQRAEV